MGRDYYWDNRGESEGNKLSGGETSSCIRIGVGGGGGRRDKMTQGEGGGVKVPPPTIHKTLIWGRATTKTNMTIIWQIVCHWGSGILQHKIKPRRMEEGLGQGHQ